MRQATRLCVIANFFGSRFKLAAMESTLPNVWCLLFYHHPLVYTFLAEEYQCNKKIKS